MIKLSKRDFDALSEEDKDLANKLGIEFDLSKTTRRSYSRCKGGDPYILVTAISCRLCNSLSIRIFRMSLNKSFLSSEEINDIPPENKLKIKNSSYTRRCCPNCYTYLASLSKEDLVQKFLLYINEARNFMY